jgi:hypothetical protein
MIGCGVHDRKISTSDVSDESTGVISPGYITVKLKEMGEGVGKVKFKLMPLGFYTFQPGPCAVGQNMAKTGRSKFRSVGHTEV